MYHKDKRFFTGTGACKYEHEHSRTCTKDTHGEAAFSRLPKFLGLLCKRDLFLQGSFTKETCCINKPTGRSHPIYYIYIYIYVYIHIYIYIWIRIYIHTRGRHIQPVRDTNFWFTYAHKLGLDFNTYKRVVPHTNTYLYFSTYAWSKASDRHGIQQCDTTWMTPCTQHITHHTEHTR